MNITKDIFYIGVNDHKIDLFEGQYVVPNGMAYNSYVICDEKIAVFDTVDKEFGEEWLTNLEKVLDGKNPDYLIVQHMEPDHSALIFEFTRKYPSAKIVGNTKTFDMIDRFFSLDKAVERVEVKNGDSLCLGKHNLTFVFAPMVHWPEVMVTYDSLDKVLFSADAFGKFGALDVEEEWDCEARRYYFGIVGKYGAQAQKLLSTAKELDVEIICPLHGPVLNENLEHYINLYDIWSSYRAETKGVFIACASIYGNTMKASKALAKCLEDRGCEKVAVCDLAREDMAEAVEDAFRHDRLVLASSTYNMDVFPCMKAFLSHLTERNFQNRTVGLMENGTWAPNAAKVMMAALEKCKNLEILEEKVCVESTLNEKSMAQIEALADALMR